MTAMDVTLRHSPAMVLVLGGFLGAFANLAVGTILHYLLGVPALPSFAIGVLTNELVHHVYYHVVYVNREIRMRTPFALQACLYVLVAVAALVPFHVAVTFLGVPFPIAALITIALLSVLSLITNRISTFSSAEIARVEYQEVGEDFYESQTDAEHVNFVRAWFHRSRFAKLHAFVMSHWRQGLSVADLGCGNCMWNTDKIPVMGVDINKGMLEWAKRHQHLVDYRIADDLAKTGLPEGAYDLVITSEVLEHLPDVGSTLQEARRILKADGKMIITVPYDFFLGPFFIMFNVNCLYQGWVNGSKYHRVRCGHVNHFTISRLRRVLGQNGFVVEKLKVVNGLTLYCTAKKA